MKKAGRNDPCPCGSGKKFKKCCEAKMIKGRFMATRVDSGSAQPLQKAFGMTTFFQSRVSVVKAPSLPVESSPEEQISGEKKEGIC